MEQAAVQGRPLYEAVLTREQVYCLVFLGLSTQRPAAFLAAIFGQFRAS
jgi:hypothetical protein